MLPFTRDQFLEVFVAYNNAIWPAQWIAYALGAVAVLFLVWRNVWSDRIIVAVVALMWVWTGVVYHGLFFAPINKAAYLFGLLFVAEGAWLAYAGLVRNELGFGLRGGVAGWVGGGLIAYAAIIYPLVGMAMGHAYPEMPVFGVTPCPVTLFTFGLLLLTTRHYSRWPLVIPFLWSLVGGSAALALAMPQDWLLLISGLVAVPLIVRGDRRPTGLAPA